LNKDRPKRRSGAGARRTPFRCESMRRGASPRVQPFRDAERRERRHRALAAITAAVHDRTGRARDPLHPGSTGGDEPLSAVDRARRAGRRRCRTARRGTGRSSRARRCCPLKSVNSAQERCEGSLFRGSPSNGRRGVTERPTQSLLARRPAIRVGHFTRGPRALDPLAEHGVIAHALQRIVLLLAGRRQALREQRPDGRGVLIREDAVAAGTGRRRAAGRRTVDAYASRARRRGRSTSPSRSRRRR